MHTQSLTSEIRNLTDPPLPLLADFPTFSLEDCEFRVIQSDPGVLNTLEHKAKLFFELLIRYKNPEGLAELPTRLACTVEEGVWDSAIETLLRVGAIAIRSVRLREPCGQMPTQTKH